MADIVPLESLGVLAGLVITQQDYAPTCENLVTLNEPQHDKFTYQ